MLLRTHISKPSLEQVKCSRQVKVSKADPRQPVSLGTLTEYGVKELLAQIGAAGPRDGIFPKFKDLNEEGLMCAPERNLPRDSSVPHHTNFHRII